MAGPARLLTSTQGQALRQGRGAFESGWGVLFAGGQLLLHQTMDQQDHEGQDIPPMIRWKAAVPPSMETPASWATA